ncbi:orotidine-5'-phosphate decarboxylase [Eubacteriales bacterium OttesenSCG-928-K08]|nr:orotidine-5'-phosphate decarboxylase [Eubacteriales bacterium OttesenSCG-928-K08]
MQIDKLVRDVKEKGPVCVGLDTQYSFLPEFLQKRANTKGKNIFEFNKRIIDATVDVAGCYKVQIACYEALGLDGMQAFASTVQYAREKGAIVISDIKRGDIASTAGQYATGHFTGDFETDFITINTYMGSDSVSPYYPFLEKGKGLFALVKTSNPSGKEIQDLKSNGKTIYQHMASLVDSWGSAFIGDEGFSSIGAVTGLTYPEEFESIRHLLPKTFLLIPGYGAQGGTGKDIATFFSEGVRGVVNSSRALLTAHKGKTEDEDFVNYTREAVIKMREDILSCLQ